MCCTQAKSLFAEEGQLVFIQLPDTLPGEPLTKAPTEKVKEEKGEKSDAKSAEVFFLHCIYYVVDIFYSH